ncbi:MAG: hypothetical protein ACLVEO_11035 [Lachnospiraceae bacterium]
MKTFRQNLDVRECHTLTIVLHCIGDFERISDHAINIMEAAQEMHDKKLIFSPKAEEELKVFSRAVQDIVGKHAAVFTLIRMRNWHREGRTVGGSSG